MIKCIFCNFRAVLCALLVLFALPAFAVHIYEADGQSGGLFGASISVLHDLDDDGRDEVLVGAPGVQSDDGQVCLWYGGINVTVAPAIVISGSSNEYFGFCVSRIGDVNGGGADDFAVGAPQADNAGTDNGRVYVFYGENVPSATPDAILEGPATTGQFGYSLAAAGDIDGDGTDDLIVGAPYTDTYGFNAGAAYVFYGDNITTGATPDLTLSEGNANEHFGWSVCGAGNFTAGADCVAVGAPGSMTIDLPAGAVYVYEGANTVADFTATGDAGAHFGWCVANAGRWNTGSYDDLAVGAPNDNSGGSDAGRVEIFAGAATPSTSPYRYVNGADGADLLGYSVAGVGDVTVSGSDDVAIGAPGHAVDGSDAGRAYLFEGGAASETDAESLDPIYLATGVNVGSLAGDRYGCWVAGAGDFDGDGAADLAIGADVGNIANNTAAGYVHVLDSSGQATPVMLTGWSAENLADGTVLLSFRFALAPQDVARVTLLRLEDGATPVIVLDGAPQSLPQVSVSSQLWRLRDEVPFSIADATVSYDLALELSDGRTFTLISQAGVSPMPPTERLVVNAAVPNPFNPTTRIDFMAPPGERATCRVYDARGAEMARIFDEVTDGRWSSAVWNGMTGGRPAAAGVYFMHVVAGNERAIERVVLVK